MQGGAVCKEVKDRWSADYHVFFQLLLLPFNTINCFLTTKIMSVFFVCFPVLLLLLLSLLPPTRPDFLVLCEGASEPPWAPALLFPSPYFLRARSGSCLAALRPQWTLAGALHAHTAGWPPSPGVSRLYDLFFTLTLTSPMCEFTEIILCIVLVKLFCILLLPHYTLSCANVALFFFLAITMKTGLLFSMKRRQACSPPWPQVSIFMLNGGKFVLLIVMCTPVQTHGNRFHKT